MTVENKNLKDGKSVGKWKLNYFAQFFCSVTFTNCKSTDKKMVTVIDPEVSAEVGEEDLSFVCYLQVSAEVGEENLSFVCYLPCTNHCASNRWIRYLFPLDR